MRRSLWELLKPMNVDDWIVNAIFAVLFLIIIAAVLDVVFIQEHRW